MNPFEKRAPTAEVLNSLYNASTLGDWEYRVDGSNYRVYCGSAPVAYVSSQFDAEFMCYMHNNCAKIETKLFRLEDLEH